MLFLDKKLLISKALFYNKPPDAFIPDYFEIIMNFVSQKNLQEFKIELKDKRILFYHQEDLNGVAVVPVSQDDIRAKSILREIVDRLFILNFHILEPDRQRRIFQQIVIPQIIENPLERPKTP